MSQRTFGWHIGLSREFVGLMELGKRRITSRTENAALHLVPDALEWRVFHPEHWAATVLEEALLDTRIQYKTSRLNDPKDDIELFIPILGARLVVFSGSEPAKLTRRKASIFVSAEDEDAVRALATMIRTSALTDS
jgi:hypothetical protein